MTLQILRMFRRNSKLLHSLFTRGRRSQISTFVATQQFNALATILRVNADTLYVFRLRTYLDSNTFLDEVSAIVDKKPYKTPATIDDPIILDEIKNALIK